ncbi:alpha-2,8-polysialyltransferase family protein [Microbacterium sp. AK031]|uniref:alpha-2,8-polysialyltransferase family protein n=1 Tax=Microbacterium sp. AK031 TaxID=2723076 RepID=UPI0021677B85|nr:alpha-2,8-polysialyltransferase family protein [Microbacterium sp. AK031]MCS3841742.1 hypothetical protein [Microbacterium sp. AK031]
MNDDSPGEQYRPSSVILVVNPMPRLYIESLASTLLERGNVRVLTFYRSPLFDDALRERLTALGAELTQFTFVGLFDEFVQLRKAAALLKAWLRRPRTTVFHCQPNHFLTNYATFGLSARQKVSVNLMPDGVANFYETNTAPYERAMRIKQLIAPLAGLSFTPYSGDYLALATGGYGEYWYFGDPGLMDSHLRVREFPAPARPASAQAHIDTRTLFLGQPTSGTDLFDDTYHELLSRIIKRYPGAVYKPHPAERFDDARRSFLTSLGFAILETDLPAEWIAADFTRVIGVVSSVLFNVRLLGWSDNVLCIPDTTLLMRLTGRNEAEIATILDGAYRLGINPVPMWR